MNNSHFRKLILDSDKQQNGTPTAKVSATPSHGARRAGLVPMTPRTVKGGIDVDFARQVRERNAALQPSKKYKTSAPKGVKFAKGYTDRAKARAEAEDDGDDKEARIKALEEQMKLGQISQEVFEGLRDSITGGDAGATHLVKGLDRQLLERVRRGEDVLGTGGSGGEKGEEAEAVADVDDELDKLGEKEVDVVRKEKADKKGVMAPPSLAGRKRTRDELMAELKAQRKAAAEAKAAPLLNGKWRRVAEEQKGRIEVDSRGREVLITVDEDGVVKKKVRKAKPKNAEGEEPAMAMPDASQEVLGADVVVPEAAPTHNAEEEEDDDIFAGVGTAYNPLGNDEDDDDDGEDSSEGESTEEGEVAQPTKPSPKPMPVAPNPQASESTETRPPPAPRNYFNDTTNSTVAAEEDPTDRHAGIQDLLKKAAKMEPLRSGADADAEASAAEQARLKRRAEMLAQSDRDLEDMDMGFGGGRGEDEGEEDGAGKVRLSEWKGGEAGWESEEGGKGGKGGVGGEKGKRKRKPKKRKGDGENAADVLRVIEGRRGKEGGGK